MAYFINRTFRKSRPLEKADPGSTEKADPMPTFTVLVKKHPYGKLEVADFISLNIHEYVQLCLNIVRSV